MAYGIHLDQGTVPLISLRYHVISIGAVFLALALGVILGSTTLSDSLLSGISGQKAKLADQVTELQAQEASLRAQLDDANSFATGIAPLAIRGTLTKRTVVLVTTSNASKSDEDALKTLLHAAGADVTGELDLTAAFGDPNRADQLRDIVTQSIPAGVQLPVAADAGTLSGALLGDLLLVNRSTGKTQATNNEQASALSALASAGFIKKQAQIPSAQLAVVLTGGAQSGPTAGDKSTMLARFATQLQKTGGGAVLAGSASSATGQGPIAVVRADKSSGEVLSTVDDVDTPAGKVVTVLALREQTGGKSGAYGTTGTATSPTPQPANS
jgi:hypothetical protein